MINSTKFRLILTLLLTALALFVLFYKPLQLGLDLQGGSQLILEAQDTEKTQVDKDAILGTMMVIRNRVDSLGIPETIISRKGLRQIIVELPGVKDPERAVKLIGDTALLEFVEGEWAPLNITSLNEEKQRILIGNSGELGIVRTYDSTGKHVESERPIILRKTVLTGADLAMAAPGTNEFGQPIVNLEFTAEGAEKFRKVTAANVGRPLAIRLDGRIISAPNINEPISGGRAQISGQFSLSEMKDLVIKLKAGALPVPVDVVSNKVVGPTLGKDSIEKSKEAGLIGLALIAVFMLFVYRLPGLIASISLIFFLLFSIATLKITSATLTLTGIAGLILTIGMAVDANVIIFERIKEERRNGVPIKTAIENGFSRAFVAIVDANITTLIAAFVLFWLGTGSIKGFSITLSIGILVSMFSAIFLTKLFINLLSTILEKDEKLLFKGQTNE